MEERGGGNGLGRESGRHVEEDTPCYILQNIVFAEYEPQTPNYMHTVNKRGWIVVYHRHNMVFTDSYFSDRREI